MEIPSPEIQAKLHQLNGWSNSRRNSFQRLEEQLDMLYHDIDSGLFGEQAKSGSFYSHIKEIKEANPKPSSELLQQYQEEFEQLITSGSV